MEEKQKPRQRVRIGLILFIVVLGALLVILDGKEIYQVIREADWRAIPAVLLFTFFSYLGTSYAFARVSHMVGIKGTTRDLTEIGFVSLVLNHVVTTGGVAGYSVRYMLMQARQASGQDIVAASLLHFYLTSLDMLGMLPVACLYLLLYLTVPPGVGFALGSLLVIFSLVFIIATALIFSSSLRRPVLRLLEKIVARVARRDIRETMSSFDEAMRRGVAVMRHDPSTLLVIMLLIVVDWTTSVASLYFCFEAFGQAISIGQLVTGYVIGIMAGVVSMVPGGLGVQEGSMAGIFALIGVSFSQAVLSSILFRVLYYFLPYFVSLGFYGRLLQDKGRTAPID